MVDVGLTPVNPTPNLKAQRQIVTIIASDRPLLSALFESVGLEFRPALPGSGGPENTRIRHRPGLANYWVSQCCCTMNLVTTGISKYWTLT